MSLQLCAMTNDLEGLKKCLKGGQGINDKDENGNAALHQCSMYGAIDVLEYLISNGADVNVLDDANRTPLINGIAAADHFKVTQLLLEAGADPNIKDEYGDTALSEAQMRNKDDTVDLLIRNGAKAE